MQIYTLYGDKCEILSAVPKPHRNIPSAREDKINWVRRFLSDQVVINLVYRAEKQNFVKGKGCILIDDYQINIDEWAAAKGSPFLYKKMSGLFGIIIMWLEEIYNRRTGMMGMCFVEGYKDFPVCNHVQDIGPENIGYQTGMFDDGLPFEVEEYEYGEGDSKVRELAIIMPDIGVEEDDCEDAEYDFDYVDAEDDEYDLDYNAYDKNAETSNIEMFQYKMELKDYSALPIGMVLRGQEDSFPIIKWYQEFIEEMGIVEYVSDIRTASVFYYTDINGNDLVQVRTGLITNGVEEAVSNVQLRDFSFREGAKKKAASIFKLVK